MSRFPGIERTYSSIDTTLTPQEAVHFPIEFLNSLDISGMPPHILILKIGCPVIVLRSLHPPHITNGTRCIIAVLHTNVVEVKILHGPSAGKNLISFPGFLWSPLTVTFHFSSGVYNFQQGPALQWRLINRKAKHSNTSELIYLLQFFTRHVIRCHVTCRLQEQTASLLTNFFHEKRCVHGSVVRML